MVGASRKTFKDLSEYILIMEMFILYDRQNQPHVDKPSDSYEIYLQKVLAGTATIIQFQMHNLEFLVHWKGNKHEEKSDQIRAILCNIMLCYEIVSGWAETIWVRVLSRCSLSSPDKE